MQGIPTGPNAGFDVVRYAWYPANDGVNYIRPVLLASVGKQGRSSLLCKGEGKGIVRRTYYQL